MVLLTALSGIARAQNVDNLDQGLSYPTLQEAIDAAAPRDTLSLVAPAFSEAVVVPRSVTIVGDGTTTLSSPGAAVFDLAAGVSFTLRGVVVAPVVGDLDLRGITALAGGNTVRVVDSRFVTGDPTADGSAIDALDPDAVIVTNVSFEPVTAGTDSALNGGAIHVDTVVPAPVTLTDATFTGLEASFSGGAVFTSGADLVCVGCTFEGTRARSGGAVFGSGGSLVVEGSLFCGVETTSPTTSGAVAAELGPVVVRTSRFVETDSNAAAGALLGLAGSSWTVENDTFLASGGDAAVDLSAADPSTVTNSLFAESDGWGLVGAATTTVAYNWFDANGAGDLTGVFVDPTNGAGPPDLVAFSRDGDCGNDALWPTFTSPLLDAGDPAILDPDGSRSDIGAYGGPLADPALHGDGDTDGASFLQDCDDTDDDVFPGAAETCNGADDDCDALTDDDDADVTGQDTFHPDCDGDGQGAGAPVVACLAPAAPPCGGDWLSVADDGPLATADCNDADPTVFTGAAETCDGVDDDCDTLVDDQDPNVTGQVRFWPDCDGDGDGDGDGDSDAVRACVAPAGTPECPAWATDDLDCDDTDPAANPGADETCAAGDRDCDGDPDLGAVDALVYLVDDDLDGFGTDDEALLCADAAPEGFAEIPGDCDDTDGATFPGASDRCGDGVDQDCSGRDGTEASLRDWWVDADGDGYGDPSAEPLLDCNYDLPGFAPNPLDCDDAAPQVNPGETEVCNDLDDDCANGVDDGPDLCTVIPPALGPVVIRPVGSCETAGGPAGAWVLLALLAVRRRAGVRS